MKEEEFNIFKFLKIDERETISSQFLVSILNENEEYFNMFLEKLDCAGYMTFKACKRVTEVSLKSRDKKANYGRADIWIGEDSGNKRKRIIIENKFFAADQWKQLSRYRAYLDEEVREGKLFYLTLQGKPASSGSAKNNNNQSLWSDCASIGYEKISYYEHIIPWLKNVKEKVEKAGKLKLLDSINQFIAVLEELSIVPKWVSEGKNLLQIDNNEKLNKEFKSCLELHFWNCLVNLISSKNANVDFDFDSRRQYSYEKVYNRYANNQIVRSYGLIINNNRIQVLKNPNYLKLSKGEFNEKNEWKIEDSLQKVIEIDLTALKNKSDAERKAEEVGELYLSFFYK